MKLMMRISSWGLGQVTNPNRNTTPGRTSQTSTLPCEHSLHLLRLEDHNAYHKPTADFEAITQHLFDADRTTTTVSC